jgi:hypothetical protein
MWDYDTIKHVAKEAGYRVDDLLALARQNDPFYVGTPGDVQKAHWFADIWRRAGYTSGVHLRRVHYWTVSQSPPVNLPDGKPYENTDNCWKYLCQTAKLARYMGLVRIADIIDNKNPDPHLHARYTPGGPDGWIDVPELDRPDVFAVGIDDGAAQPYHLEVWCEKSTMNDVLLPVCRRYGANLVTFEGEVSITACYDLIRRIRESGGKPARVWYLSDFDPAGNSMPVAMSRKVEYMLGRYELAYDVRITPSVLTPEQVQRYRLPRTPIKESERRAASFEDAFGAGATELDALEALHPGELARIVEAAVSPYYSRAAAQAAQQAYQEFEAAVNARIEAVTSRYRAELDALAGMVDGLREIEVDAGAYAVERHDPHVVEDDGWLFDSGRDYLDQLSYYRNHKGK